MFKEGDLPKTESLSKRVLNIPLYPDIKEKDLDYIIKSIKEFLLREEEGVRSVVPFVQHVSYGDKFLG